MHASAERSTIIPRAPRQWTAERRKRFLDCLSAWGNVRAAAAACGPSAQSVYKLRARDPDFARAWDRALAHRHAVLDQELVRRIESHPRLAETWRQMQAASGGEIGSLDTVNSVNAVSTAST